MLSFAGILVLAALSWADSVQDSIRLPEADYQAFLRECLEPVPPQLSASSAALSVAETGEGRLQLTSVQQSTQEVYTYTVTRDSSSGVLTVESEGSVYVVILEDGTRQVTVKRAVRKTYGEQTTLFTADDDGKLVSVFGDEFGQLQFTPIDIIKEVNKMLQIHVAKQKDVVGGWAIDGKAEMEKIKKKQNDIKIKVTNVGDVSKEVAKNEDDDGSLSAEE